ncbi:MAG: hypothetical protein LC643_07220 [Bacteroidales bacterium]|nr:hypothetical protein [Bacteroidales bacterium]
MKLKIYSISLLLAFLAALIHEVIPHYHHDLEEYALSFQSNNSDHHHSSTDFDPLHHGEGNHHYDTEDAHPRNFPFHHHLSADGDFDYIRIHSNKDVHATFSFVAELSSHSKAIISAPPELDLIRFTDRPFLITTIFEPGAIGLRAPPSIA